MQIKGSPETTPGHPSVVRLSAALLAAVGLGLSCHASQVTMGSPKAAALSPTAQVVAPFDAYRLAKTYAGEHPGARVLVGSGESMMPLYKDHTVVIAQRIAMRDLRAGMTVVYLGDSGRPVAHVLVKKTWGGWVAKGVANPTSDSELVTSDNLIGVVVKAYEPTSSLMVALLDEARMRASIAAMP